MLIMRLFLLFLIHSALVCASLEKDANRNITWDYLLFAQIWPYSMCDVANSKENDTCLVPKQVTSGWTIHGLWPSRLTGSMGPDFCIPKDHFDLEKIKPLVPELLHHWPNLIPSASLDSLWHHEWIKHGTCAEQLESINGEKNYFSTGLQLNEVFSIMNILSLSGIEPSDAAKFKASDVVNAFQKSKGTIPLVHCLKSPKKEWYLVDVRVCLDKTLKPIDCPHHTHEKPHLERSELLVTLGLPNVETCPPNAFLYYPIPRADHYHSDEQHEMHSYAYKYKEELSIVYCLLSIYHCQSTYMRTKRDRAQL